MFEDITAKFKKLRMPEESLIKKIERIKKTPEPVQMNIEAIIKNVSTQVLEQIRPFLDQKLQELEASQMAAAAISAAPEVARSPVPQTSSRTAAEKQQYDNENIKLQSIDNKAETSIILLNWIEFLLEKVGRNNLSEILEYYIDIAWISEEVCEKMIVFPIASKGLLSKKVNFNQYRTIFT
jgi:flagellar protein FlaD